MLLALSHETDKMLWNSILRILELLKLRVFLSYNIILSYKNVILSKKITFLYGAYSA